MKNTILIDFDGVIRHWSHLEIDRLAKSLELDLNPLFICAFATRHLQPAITGRITHEQWCENVKLELSYKYDYQIATSLVDAWYNLSAEIDLVFLDSIRTHAPYCEIVLVTNATSRLNNDLINIGLEGAFDEIVNSSTIGVVKPKKAFFNKTMSLLDVSPTECVFIDDSAKNVESARSLGMASICHRSNKETLEFLTKIFTQSSWSI